MRTSRLCHDDACSLTEWERCVGAWCLWRRPLLAVLLALILFHFPWRLAVVVTQAAFMRPGLTRLTDGDGRYWETQALESRLNALSWSVQYLPAEAMINPHTGQPLYGRTSPQEGIWLADYLHWDQKLATLSHEAGHALHPGYLTSPQDEVFAECVSTLYTHDGFREHARYLSRYKGDLWVAIAEWRNIYRVAAVLER